MPASALASHREYIYLPKVFHQGRSWGYGIGGIGRRRNHVGRGVYIILSDNRGHQLLIRGVYIWNGMN